MRLVTYSLDDLLRPGAVVDSDVYDISDAVSSVLALVEGGAQALARVESLIGETRPVAGLADVRLHAPLQLGRRPVFCVGWNYLDHATEMSVGREGQRRELPSFPTFFSKPGSTIVGPDEGITYDASVTTKLDYEAELAVVIGRSGRSIPSAAALDHVFGYTLANDLSARDVQHRHGGQWFKGKSMDTYCPMGPVLVTRDEVGDPQALTLTCTVNGQVRQKASTSQMIFSVADLVSALSLGMTIFQGDVLLTGTPAGVGASRNPAAFLGVGDIVTVSISEIGELRNRVEDPTLVMPAATSAR